MSNVKEKMKRINEEPEAPSKIYITSGDEKGNVKLFWEPVKNVYSYIIQRSQVRKEKTLWKLVDITDSSDYLITGLRSGVTYSFRIASVAKKGQSDWSKTVQKKTP